MRRNLTIAVMLAGLAVSLEVEARQVDLSDAPVIRKRIHWRKGRFEVAPAIGATLNDPYVRTMLIGISAEWFPTTWLGIGADFRYGVGFNTGQADKVESFVSGWNEAESLKDASERHEQRASFTNLEMLAGAHLSLVPLYGKMMWFDSLEVAFDLHILVGAGYARVAGTGELDSENTFYPMVGLGARLLFLEWFGITVQVRDYIVEMSQVAPLGYYNIEMGEEGLTSTFVREGPRKEWINNFAMTFGIAFYFPLSLDHEK